MFCFALQKILIDNIICFVQFHKYLMQLLFPMKILFPLFRHTYFLDIFKVHITEKSIWHVIITYYIFGESSIYIAFNSVQSFSCVPLFVTPWTAARQVSLSITNSWRLLKLMSIDLVMLSYHLMLCHPLLLLPSIFLNIRFFSNESVLPTRR